MNKIAIIQKRSTETLKKNIQDTSFQVVVILNQKHTFLLRSQIIEEIKYFKEQIAQSQTLIIFIHEELNAKAFKKIIKYFQGCELEFQRNNEVFQLMEVLSFFQTKELMETVVYDIIQNFEDYNFFLVFQASKKFNIQKLKSKCYEELINYQFEQINFNRLDLLECTRQCFQRLIKMHQYFKNKQLIEGLNQSTVKQIITQHGQHHQYRTETDSLLSVSDQFCQEMAQLSEKLRLKNQAGWSQFNIPSFNLSSLSESITFGNRSQESFDSPSKIIRKKISRSINLCDLCNSLEKRDLDKFQTQKEITSLDQQGESSSICSHNNSKDCVERVKLIQI